MSFKREGDDGSQLNLLKKRRVAELLSQDIPDDEAMLMSSGRYACTVCHYRPVFDTVDMLTVHRAGKKHHHASELHFAKKRELAQLVQKRHRESQLRKAGSHTTTEEAQSAPLLQRVEEAKKKILLKQAPYNPCHSYRNDGPSTKPKPKLFFEGVRQIQLKNTRQKTTSANQDPQNPKSTNQEQPNSNSTNHQQPYSKSSNRVPSTSSKQTPSTGVSSFQLKPYVPKSKRGSAHTHANSCNKSSTQIPKYEAVQAPTSPPERLQGSSEERRDEHSWVEVANIQYINDFQSHDTCILRPKYTERLKEGSIQYADKRLSDGTRTDFNARKRLQCDGQNMEYDRLNDEMEDDRLKDTLITSSFQSSSQSADSRNASCIGSTSGTRVGDGNDRLKSGMKDSRGEELAMHDGTLSTDVRGSKGRTGKSKKKSANMSEDRKKELQRYLELTSAGWVQDHGGQWIKGQDVEFDSDEEPPT